MIEDCRNCGKLSEIALLVTGEAEIRCQRCRQSVTRNTREAAVIAWNCSQTLWDEQTEEAFNRIMAGGVE